MLRWNSYESFFSTVPPWFQVLPDIFSGSFKFSEQPAELLLGVAGNVAPATPDVVAGLSSGLKDTNMRITKFGHSCLLVEDNGARILSDPGVFSSGWESLRDLTTVLITHLHPDHLDVDKLPGVLAANPLATVFADPGSVKVLAEHGIGATAVDAGEILNAGNTTVEVFGDTHAVIHSDLPSLENRGYLISGRLYLPGDSLGVPAVPVEILALPASAPWMALKEGIEFMRAVDPTTVIPIHEKTLSATGMVYSLLEKLKPADTQWLNIDDGQPVLL